MEILQEKRVREEKGQVLQSNKFFGVFRHGKAIWH